MVGRRECLDLLSVFHKLNFSLQSFFDNFPNLPSFVESDQFVFNDQGGHFSLHLLIFELK